MRRAAIITVRAAVVLLLVAAVRDWPIPSTSDGRVRVHLVDRSGSVRVPGPRESLTPADAERIVASDLQAKASQDAILRAEFTGGLRAALETALARNPTEIILYTDGRDNPGDALLLCRARGIPVHLFPLGPTSVGP